MTDIWYNAQKAPNLYILFQPKTSFLILEADPELLYSFFIQDVGYPVWMLECWAPNIKPEEVGRRGRGQEEKEEVESVVTDGKEKERTPVFHQNRMWAVIVLADGNRQMAHMRPEMWAEMKIYFMNVKTEPLLYRKHFWSKFCTCT